jgi:hypothetical protein
MATRNKNKATVVVLAEKLTAGTDKHLANETQVKFAGGSFTPAQITSKLKQIVTLRADEDAAKAATKAKLAAEKADMPALRIFMDALVSFVKVTYGTMPDVLADFGIAPKARTPLTVEAKTAAAAKRKATRAARNTMGAKQRKKVKGAVVGINVTPVTATQPVAAATPSSAGSTSAGATSPAQAASAGPTPRTA